MHVAVYTFIPFCLTNVVNRNSLECADDQENTEGADANSDDDDSVCATHGVTYPSVCRLLQDTGNEAVAYAGECDREECQGGSVSVMCILLGGGVRKMWYGKWHGISSFSSIQ